MSWIGMLYQTYENNIAMAGKPGEAVTLSVIAHMVVNAQIEVTINSEGDFITAEEVEKEKGKTLIPVTESSAGRSSGIAPHALSDMLSYVAGDYADYITDKKIIDKCNQKYEAYIKNLELWKNSSFTHEKVEAIYRYVIKKQLMQDLFQRGLIKCEENGCLSDAKMKGQPYEKAMVRFIVLSGKNGESPKAWQDASLMDCYTQYYLEGQSGEKNLCFVTGRQNVITNNHPKGIIQANYGAKLISANDKENFTYRGRFTTPDEACTVSYEASQKAHNALSWLAAKQGFVIGTQDKRTYICWNPKGKAVPNPEDSFTLDGDEIPTANTQEEYKGELAAVVNGYKKKLEETDDIVVIALDAATTGRLSITYYNEFGAHDFLERLEAWNETCCWLFTDFRADGKPVNHIKTPSPKQIVRCAFGTEQGGFIEVNDKVLKEQVQRIYYCMLDGMRLPWDMVHSIAEKASNPLAYKNRGNYEKVLSVACALLAKFMWKEGGKNQMTLDMSNTDRSYLFGRLLAIAEKIEKDAAGGEQNRISNAIRLQAAFVNHPMYTWKTLETALNPYYQKLPIKLMEYYRAMITDIMGLMDLNEREMNKSLTEVYLFGYYAQRKSLYTSKADEAKED